MLSTNKENKMNKKQVVDLVANLTDVKKCDVEKVIDSLTHTIKFAVAKGESVKIKGFGTFTSKKHKPRAGRNPQNNKVIKINATARPKFLAGAEFKEMLK